jgi:hypothetical protein
LILLCRNHLIYISFDIFCNICSLRRDRISCCQLRLWDITILIFELLYNLWRWALLNINGFTFTEIRRFLELFFLFMNRSFCLFILFQLFISVLEILLQFTNNWMKVWNRFFLHQLFFKTLHVNLNLFSPFSKLQWGYCLIHWLLWKRAVHNNRSNEVTSQWIF